MRDNIDTGLERRPPHLGLEDAPRPEWVDLPERSNTLAMHIIARLALTLGRPAARSLLYPICLYFLIFSFKTRASSTKYLRKILSREPSFADTFRHYHTFAATLLDRVFLMDDQFSRFDVCVHDEDILTDMATRGEGCILLGAHMGSFEIIGALGRRKTGTKISFVMYEENARKLNSVLNAINPAHPLKVISLGKFDSMLKVESALNQGEFIGMLGDRTLQSEGSVACQFLGEQARFPSGPIHVAAILKRPIVLMFGLYRGDNRYDIYFERLIDTWHMPTLTHDLLLKRTLHRYVERVAHYCHDAPYNWNNFYDFWQ